LRPREYTLGTEIDRVAQERHGHLLRDEQQRRGVLPGRGMAELMSDLRAGDADVHGVLGAQSNERFRVGGGADDVDARVALDPVENLLMEAEIADADGHSWVGAP